MPGRVLTPKDCYALINLIAAEATGQDGTLTAVDSSSFVSVGESILRSGTENTLNALSLVLGRTFVAVRPYKAKLNIINTIDTGLFANRMRKISYYSRYAQPSGAFNTDLYVNHAMGYDNTDNSGASVGTMWEQNAPIPLEMNFGGSSVWDDCTTIYEKQLQVAFRDESEFAKFVSGIMVEKGNDLETEKEAFNRATLLNYMAGLYDLDMSLGAGMSIDMTAGFNYYMGNPTPAITAQDILSPTYRKQFLEYFVATVKKLSNQLTNRSVARHWSPPKTINGVTYELLRHTPKDKQKLILYRPFMIEAEAMVLPEIFNDEYLKISNYESVDFWQDEIISSGINVTPAIPDTSDPTTQTVGTTVQLDYVLGVLYDEDALMTDYQFEGAFTTPVEARKLYRNTFWHYRKNSINDFTENGIILYLG